MIYKYQVAAHLREWRDDILIERERWAYWLPVFLGIGIGIYFSLPFEPYLSPVALAVVVLGIGYYRLKHTEPASQIALALLAVFAGILAAGIRTHMVYSPMLDRSMGPMMIEANIREREIRENGSRLLLDGIKFEGRREMPALAQIRLTLRSSVAAEPPPVGASIRVLVNLLPMTEPSAPGSYNFRLQAYYERIGATAIALRAPEVIDPAARKTSLAENWRNAAAIRIHEAIGGSEGAIAVALMTGERGAIDEKTNEDMRKAGTAHMLSISGMHIGMVGGFVFFLVRSLLALFPAIALRYPIKQLAAIIALGAVVGYTWLVGAPIPAQRSMLMAGLVFVAILLDRQALSMRSVALAAGIIMLLFPESILNPGFQLSFAAIVMLIAGYEWWRLNKPKEEHAGWGRWAWRYLLGIIVTSIIAGLATMPYGAWHFHRLQLLGVLGNLIAMPLTGVLVMPPLVLAYILLPFGLEWPALYVMGIGLEGVTRSAEWVGNMPGADLNASQFSLTALIIMTLGGLWFAIWQRKVRWLGMAVVMFGLLLAPFAAKPVAIVSAEGQVAMRGTDGRLYYERPPRGLIARDWSRAYDGGNEGRSWRNARAVGISCDVMGCAGPNGIAVGKQAEALAEDCTRAGIVIMPDMRVKNCAARVIDKTVLRENGSHMIYADGSIRAARNGSPRPWQPYYKGWLSYSGEAARPDAPAL